MACEQLVAIRAVAPPEACRLADVAARDLQDLRPVELGPDLGPRATRAAPSDAHDA
jgi:hypothetical protein